MNARTLLMDRWLQTLKQALQARSARERRLIALALALGLGAAVWLALLAPVLATWRQAPEMQARLDGQWQQMLNLQAQARQLQKATRLSREEAQAWLDSSTREVFGGTARWSVQDRQVRLTLQGVSAAALSQWLVQARQNARLLPVQVQIQPGAERAQASRAGTPSPSSKGAAPAGSAEILWHGTVVLQWP